MGESPKYACRANQSYAEGRRKLTVTTLATLYRKQGKYEQAEPLYQRALRNENNTWGHSIQRQRKSYMRLQSFRKLKAIKIKPGTCYERALAVREQVLGPDQPKTKETRKRYLTLLREMGQHDEAASLEEMQSEPTKTEEERKIPPEE